MHKLMIISTLLFGAACGHKQPAANATTQNATSTPKTEAKAGDKDSKVEEATKDKHGDKDGDKDDDDDDDGPAKAKHD